MLERFMKINDKQIILGQTSSGIWYCKELPCNCIKEAEKKIGEINRILNIYNECKKKEQKKETQNKTKTKKLDG